jgi:SAM-dependent methyltransferase
VSVQWFIDAIDPFMAGNASFLDLCCGNGRLMREFRIPDTVAVDIYHPYLAAYKEVRPDINFINADVTDISALPDRKFDLIACFDGLEHIDKVDALRLLEWIDTHFNKCSIVLTPDRFVANTPQKQIERSWGIKGGAAYQIHRCGMKPYEFISRGYRLIASNKTQRGKTKYNQNVYVKTK